MTQINVIGSLWGISGYDSHTRNLVNALTKFAKVRISTNPVHGWERLANDRELEMVKRAPEKDEINLIITHPMHWRLNAFAKRNWAYCVWEGDKVPDCFIPEMLNEEIEYIFVPSSHTATAIENTARDLDESDKILDKVKLIPHGVDLTLFYPKEKPTETTTFLLNKGWRNLEDRGGTQYAIRAYLEEFTDKDNVQMIVKVNPAYGIPDLNAMVAALSPRIVGMPKLFMDVNGYEYKGLVELYNKANVFVATTRAEAYGIPMIEACATGLAVLTTGYGGQVDFIKDKENGLLIDYDLTEVKHEIAYEGCSWATPRIEDIRKKIRYMHEHPEEVKRLGENGLKTARDNTWDKSAQLITSLV